MKLVLIRKQFLMALAAGVLSVCVAALAFFVLEPQVSRSAVSAVPDEEFTIKQTIGDAISFNATVNDVVMNGTLDGLTGGNATGTTQAVVSTNSAGGYYMTIRFENQGPAMIGEATGNTGIRDYATTTPQFNIEPNYQITASSAALFTYTATTSNAGDLDDSFRDNGLICNVNGGTGNGRCFMKASTTAFQLVDRGSSAPYGATTSIQFRVVVPNNPTPSIDSDVYTATATLTATTQ